MKKPLIRLLKGVVNTLPKSVKQLLADLSGLTAWYRKNLNQHYFESYNFDSSARTSTYQDWCLKQSAHTEHSDPQVAIACVINASTANRLEKLPDSLNSISNGSIQPSLVLVNADSELKPQVLNLVGQCLCPSITWAFADQTENVVEQALYCCFINAGDRLAADAFAQLQYEVTQHPNSSVIYADHDYLNQHGERYLPQFKPAWNLDLQLTTHYVSNAGFWLLGCEELEGVLSATDNLDNILYNLTVERALNGKSDISHTAKMLFHFDGNPTSHNLEALNLSSANLASLGLSAGAVTFSNGCFNISWPLPADKPLVSLIIPTKNALKLVKSCINSILEKTDYDNFEILLVDNQSDEPASLKYFERLSHHPKIRVIKYDAPFNYSAINNFAVEQASGEIIALVNNDIEVIDDNWLSEMVSHALRPSVGCVGAKLFYSDNTIQHAGVIIGYGGVAGHAHKHFPMHHSGYMNRLQAVQNFSAVTAACLVVKKDIYHQVGGLNEQDLTVAFNDVDFCLKVQAAGYRNVWTPYARLYHHESVSRGSDQSGAKLKRFEAEIDFMKNTWKTDIQPDPAYNPNLTLKREDFGLPE